MMDAIVGGGGGKGGGGFILYINRVCEVKWHTSNHPSASLQKRRMGGKIFQVMNEWNIHCSLSIIQVDACKEEEEEEEEKEEEWGEGFSTNE
jgi:hypothetical protein